MYVLSKCGLYVVVCLLIQINNHNVHTQTSKVCNNLSENEQASKLDALHDRFPVNEKKAMDIVIVMDRSTSVTSSNLAFSASNNLVTELLEYLTINRRVYIHPLYARFALISFGSTDVIDLNALTKERALHACEAIDKIQNELGDSHIDNMSNFEDALQNAKSLFESSDRLNADVVKILWLFYDGDVPGNATVISDCDTCDYFRSNNVIMFVAGIDGAWLNRPGEERRLESMAYDSNHFSCVSQWSEIISTTTASASVSGEDEEVYSTVSSSDNCATECTSGKQCACHMSSRSYSCQECEDIYGCDGNNYEAAPGGFISGMDQLWSYVIVGLSVAGGILLIIFIISCIGCCCSIIRDRIASSKAPPVPMRTKKENDLVPMFSHDPIYNNEHEAQAGNEHHVMPAIEEVETVNETYHYAYDKKQPMEKTMPGWGKFLYEEKQHTNLKHICIRSVKDKQQGAWTAGFQLSPKDRKIIIEALYQGSNYPESSISIGGNLYTIDKHSMSDEYIIGIRRKSSQDGGFTTEEFIVCQAGDYFIIVVSDQETGELCREKVFEYKQYLTNYSSGSFETQIYSNVL